MSCPGEGYPWEWVWDDSLCDYEPQCSFCGLYSGNIDQSGCLSMSLVPAHPAMWPSRLRPESFLEEEDFSLWVAASLEVTMAAEDGDLVYFTRDHRSLAWSVTLSNLES